jgi:exopolysaccharide biosynthesis polyprenyl glycosylphosphotransferase
MSTMPPTTRQPVHRTPVADRAPPPRFRRLPPVELPSANREVAPAADHRERDRPFIHGLVVADILATILGVAVCLAVARHARPTPAILAVVPLVVGLLSVAGLYRRDEVLISKTTLDEAPRLGAVAGIAALVIWQAEQLLFTGALGKTGVGVLWLALLVALGVCRRAAREVAYGRTDPERCLLVGPPGSESRLTAAFAGAGNPAILVARVSPDRLMHHQPGRRRAVSATALVGLIDHLDADRVVVADEATDGGTTLELLRISRSVDVRVSFLPTVLGALGPALEFDNVHGLPLIGVQRFGLTRSERIAKRALDLSGASLLTLAMSPLLALIALAIKLDSRGPVLFRQTRIGRDGRAFEICKFRTMVTDAEARKRELRAHNEAVGGLFKISEDPRVTRVGRLLRRTSLDELPQLLNVLRGEMSLVGPRPLVCDEDEQIQGWDRRRLQLTPGMTGQWQILGSTRVPLQEMVKIDYRYVAGWSLWEDVKILVRTVPHVLARRGM